MKNDGRIKPRIAGALDYAAFPLDWEGFQMKKPKGKAPTRDQATGAFSEQNELFDLPAFCPILPPMNSASLVQRGVSLNGTRISNQK